MTREGFPGVTFSRVPAPPAVTVYASPIRAAAPPAEAVTPALIEAAKKEGKVVHYTSVDLPLAEKVAKAFEAKYPGIAVRVERTGAERVFTRIAQERSSNIHACDVVQSSDAAHFVVWKRDGCWRPTCPRTSRSTIRAEHKDPDGLFASYRVYLCCMALQHQPGEGRRGAEELSPTCSIRNGSARSSRRIRATAARS